jgi:hypothetical protein
MPRGPGLVIDVDTNALHFIGNELDIPMGPFGTSADTNIQANNEDCQNDNE